MKTFYKTVLTLWLVNFLIFTYIRLLPLMNDYWSYISIGLIFIIVPIRLFYLIKNGIGNE